MNKNCKRKIFNTGRFLFHITAQSYSKACIQRVTWAGRRNILLFMRSDALRSGQQVVGKSCELELKNSWETFVERSLIPG